MPTPIEIIIVGVNASDGAFNSALGNMDRLNSGVKQSNEHLGMSRREYMRTGAEAAFYARTAVASLGQVDEGLGKTIGLATQLGESFMFGGLTGVAIAGIATGIGAWMGQMQAAQAAASKAREDLAAPFIKTREELVQLAGWKDPLKPMTDSLKVSRGELEAYIKSGQEAAQWVYTLGETQLVHTQNLQEQADAIQKWTDVAGAIPKALAEGYTADSIAWQALMQDYDAAKAKMIASNIAVVESGTTLEGWTMAVKTGMEDYRTATVDQQLALDALARTLKTASVLDDYRTRQQQMGKMADDARTKSLLDQKAAYDKLATAVGGYLSSAVSGAMKPTAVTPEDMRLSGLGKYTEKWDEPARQLNDIAENGDKVIAKYPQIQKFLEETGMTAGEAAKQYESFALYTSPEGKKLYEGADAKGKLSRDAIGNIKSMLGTEAMRKDVESELWGEGPNALDKDLKEKLKGMGLQSLSDVEAQSMGLRPAMKVVKAGDFDATLGMMKQDILNTIPAEMQTTVYVTYKAVIPPNDTGKPPDNVENANPGLVPSPHASGGRFGAGELMKVGEQGTELVRFDRSGYVYNAGDTQRALSGGDTFHFHFDGAPPATRRDAKELARMIGREFQRARG